MSWPWPFAVGDPVTVAPPYDDDPLILSFQHYGRVAALTEAGIMVELGAAAPGQLFGPFQLRRLDRGWKDANGRWR